MQIDYTMVRKGLRSNVSANRHGAAYEGAYVGSDHRFNSNVDLPTAPEKGNQTL